MSPLVAAEMKNMTTQQVVLILGLSTLLATVIIWLTVIGADPVAIVSGIAPILLLVGGAFGWAKINDLKRGVDEVKDQGNGRLTKLQDDNKELHEKIASLSLLIQHPPELEK